MRVLGYIILLVVLLVISVDYGREFLDSDRCLDLSGSYDYAAGVCDWETNHPFLPYWPRHRTLAWSSVIAVAVGALLIRAGRRAREAAG